MAKDKKSKSKYRDEDICPTSFIRLNDVERNIVSEKLLELLGSSCDQEKKVGFVLAISYCTGKTVEQVLELDIRSQFSADYTQYNLSVPIHRSQWKPETGLKADHFFQPIFELISLPLPSAVGAAAIDLLAGLPVTIKSLGELIGNPLVLKKTIAKQLKQLRLNHSSHIELNRVYAALKSEIYVAYQNPTLAYLLTCKTHLSPPHTRFYYVPNNRQLIDAWNTVQNKLWDSADMSPSIGYKDLAWNGYVLKSAVLRKAVHNLKQRPSASNLVKFHNWFTMYTVSMLSWNLGHRAVRDPFCEEELVDLESGLLLINDKRKHGSNNFRILKIPEILSTQYLNYIDHLTNFVRRIEDSDPEGELKEICLYMKKIIASGNRKVEQRRLFFLISKSLKIKGVSPKKLKKWWNQNGLPVKSNFGRHHVATELINYYGISYPVAQLFLGHSMKSKTSLLSEVVLSRDLKSIEIASVSIILGPGWESLLGLPTPNQPGTLKLGRIKSPASNIYPFKRPGYVLRAEFQKEQENRIRVITKEIKACLNEVTSDNSGLVDEALQDRRNALEADFRNRIIGLDFPHHKEWRSLLSFIRVEFNNENPMPSVLRFNNLSSGISFLSKSSAKKYTKSKNASLIWLDWLNTDWVSWVTEGECAGVHQSKMVATLVLQAALLGGAPRSSVTAGLGQRQQSSSIDSYKIYNTNGLTHIELYRSELYEVEGEKLWEERWVDRWIPDQFSKALLVTISKYQDIDSSQVELYLGELRSKLDLPFASRSILADVAKISQPVYALNYAGYSSAVQTGKIKRRPLSIEAWSRLRLNQRWDSKASRRSKPNKVVRTDTKISNTSFDTEKFREIIKNGMKSLRASGSHRRRDQCERFAEMFEYIQMRLTRAPLSISMFLSWAACFSRRGTRGFSTSGKLKLKDTTLDPYITRLYDALFRADKFPVFEAMSGNEITEFYRQAINKNVGKTTTHNLKQLLYIFQMNSESEYLIVECDWEVLDGIPISYSVPLHGNIVTIDEYELLLRSLSSEAVDSNYIELLSCLFISLMMFRFGLRPSEASRLTSRDLVFDDVGNIKTVIVRQSKKGSTKTKSGVRQVFSTFELLDVEHYIVRNCFERAVAFSEINPDFAISSRYISGETPYEASIWMQAYTQKISQKLKEITGDSSVSAYTLRHSYVTAQVASVIKYKAKGDVADEGEFYYPQSNVDLFSEAGRYGDPLKSMSKSLGHRSVSTTLRIYTHCSELFDVRDSELISKINDDVYSTALGKSKSAFQAQKSRLGNRDVVIDNYVKKRGFRSLEQFTAKYQNTKEGVVESIQVKTPSPVQIADFLIIKARAKGGSITSLYDDHGFRRIAEAIVTHQRGSYIKSVPDYFSNAKLAQLERVMIWLQKNDEFLLSFLRLKNNRVKLQSRLSLFFKCLEPESGKWVVLNENDVTSITSLFNSLGLEHKVAQRSATWAHHSSKSEGVSFNNHAANRKHKDQERKLRGYELKVTFDEWIKNNRSVNILMVLLGIYVELS